MKTLVVVLPRNHFPLNEWKMPEIRNNPNTDPGAGTFCEGPSSPGSFPPIQQWGPGCHHITARKK